MSVGRRALPAMTGPTWAMLLVLSLLWGGSFFFVDVIVAELPPFTTVLGRVALAALVLHLVLLARGRQLPRRPALILPFLLLGLSNNLVPFSLIFWGQTQIGAGLAAILNATTPLFACLVAHVATDDERLSARKLTGIALGIAGVAIMIGPDALMGIGGHVAAQLAILGAACSYGVASVFGRRFGRLGLTPVQVATGQLTATSCMILPLVVLVDRPWALAWPSPPAIGALVALAVLSTALAYILYFRILATAGAINASLVTILVPPSALALGVLFLDERVGPAMLAGFALIAFGLLVLDGRLQAASRQWLERRGLPSRKASE